MTRVLLVDDEEAIRDAVAYSLRAEGLEVETCDNGASAMAAVDESEFDLIVLDVMLPDISGVEIARRVRARSAVPILMLTARDAEADVVLAFEAGADDYVPKPFSMRELVSRARAILRRRELDRAQPGDAISISRLEIDLLRHVARIDGRDARLTRTEFKILVTLAGEDRTWTRRELLAAAWDTDFVPDDRSCDVHVANIRRKIEDDPSDPSLVVTVRGVGYRLAR